MSDVGLWRQRFKKLDPIWGSKVHAAGAKTLYSGPLLVFLGSTRWLFYSFASCRNPIVLKVPSSGPGSRMSPFRTPSPTSVAGFGRREFSIVLGFTGRFQN